MYMTWSMEFYRDRICRLWAGFRDIISLKPHNYLALTKAPLSVIYRCVNWARGWWCNSPAVPAPRRPSRIAKQRCLTLIHGFSGLLWETRSFLPGPQPRVQLHHPGPLFPLWCNLALWSLTPGWEICGDGMMYEVPFVKILFSVKHDVFPPDLQVGCINHSSHCLCYISCLWFIKLACKSFAAKFRFRNHYLKN